MNPDFAVYGSDYQLKLIAEVKSKFGASDEWAVETRGNLIAYSVIPASPYFLLALADRFHLWADAANKNAQARPDYSVPTEKVLSAYLRNSSLSLQTIGREGFEFLFRSWLGEIVNFNLNPETVKTDQPWLFDSGLYQAIHDGFIINKAAA